MYMESLMELIYQLEKFDTEIENGEETFGEVTKELLIVNNHWQGRNRG